MTDDRVTHDKGTTVAQQSSASRTTDRLRVGDAVQVRSQEEILATLDERGELDSLPFMPEMLQFCGTQLKIEKVANKVCDTITSGGLRKMDDAVHLTAARCDGSAHGGCENACLLYFKDEWLTRPDEPDVAPVDSPSGAPRMTLPLLQATTRKPPGPDGEELFSCQATELNRATVPQSFLDMSQYVTDYKSGNANVFWIVRAFLVGLFNRVQNKSKKILPRKLWFRAGLPWPFVHGKVVGRTPRNDLDLQPGDRVRIKSKEEIEETLTPDLLNRGLGFDGEMARFCGREAVVERRVQKVINEKNSKMVHMKSPCIVLKDLVCEGAYAANCPRRWISFWREIWLERVEDR